MNAPARTDHLTTDAFYNERRNVAQINDGLALDAAVFDAIADAMVIAETYSRTALDMAAIRDRRGLAYSLRCASAAVSTAVSMFDDLRPAQKKQGGRAA